MTSLEVVPGFQVNIEESGFMINYIMDETSNNYRLLKPEGSLDTKTPYADHKGVTQMPLIDDNSVFSITSSPLHCLILCLDFCVKPLLYHSTTHIQKLLDGLSPSSYLAELIVSCQGGARSSEMQKR